MGVKVCRFQDGRVGGQLVMKLAAGIGRTTSGELSWIAHDPRGYTNEPLLKGWRKCDYFSTILERAKTEEGLTPKDSLTDGLWGE